MMIHIFLDYDGTLKGSIAANPNPAFDVLNLNYVEALKKFSQENEGNVVFHDFTAYQVQSIVENIKTFSKNSPTHFRYELREELKKKGLTLSGGITSYSEGEEIPGKHLDDIFKNESQFHEKAKALKDADDKDKLAFFTAFLVYTKAEVEISFCTQKIQEYIRLKTAQPLDQIAIDTFKKASRSHLSSLIKMVDADADADNIISHDQAPQVVRNYIESLDVYKAEIALVSEKSAQYEDITKYQIFTAFEKLYAVELQREFELFKEYTPLDMGNKKHMVATAISTYSNEEDTLIFSDDKKGVGDSVKHASSNEGQEGKRHFIQIDNTANFLILHAKTNHHNVTEISYSESKKIENNYLSALNNAKDSPVHTFTTKSVEGENIIKATSKQEADFKNKLLAKEKTTQSVLKIIDDINNTISRISKSSFLFQAGNGKVHVLEQLKTELENIKEEGAITAAQLNRIRCIDINALKKTRSKIAIHFFGESNSENTSTMKLYQDILHIFAKSETLEESMLTTRRSVGLHKH